MKVFCLVEMKLYRFSPIQSKEELANAIHHIHSESYKLCKSALGKYLPNAGNIGIFCHYDEEWEFLTEIRKKLTADSANFNQKYFKLHEPIVIPATEGIPEAKYEFLYIRKPDPYRHHVGDLDFYLEQEEYESLKNSMLKGKNVEGARVFDRPDLDMIELHNPDVDVLAYVSTEYMTDRVRVKQSELTNL